MTQVCRKRSSPRSGPASRRPRRRPCSLQPDDARLVDLVSLITSGMSEAIIIEQVKQSEQAYNLTVNDLLYLKQNGARETMIAALMATSTGPPDATATALATAPSELVFDDLVLVKQGLFGFFSKDRPGRLVMRWRHADLERRSWFREELPVPNLGHRKGLVHLRGAFLRKLLPSDQLQDREGRPLPVPGQPPRLGIQRRRRRGHGGAAHVLPAPQLRDADHRRLTL